MKVWGGRLVVSGSSTWPKRLIIVSVVILALSIAAMASSYKDYMGELDPGKNHIAEIDGGESLDVNLSKSSSYVLFRTSDAPKNCTVVEEETGTEIDIYLPSILQPDRQGADGQWYLAVGAFIPEESGTHTITNSAEDGEILWVIDETQIGEDSDSFLIFNGGCMGLLCGGCLLPVAIVVWFSNRRKGNQAKLMMQTKDGRLVPIAPASDMSQQQRVPSTDEIWRSVHGGETLNLVIPPIEVEEEVPPPFADRPDGSYEPEKILEEIESITSPRLTKKQDEVEENTSTWKSWDEG
tara:strand:+ start:918 stop:1802 length:885 start_codon:yes stop_codon:yes gene_type:complete